MMDIDFSQLLNGYKDEVRWLLEEKYHWSRSAVHEELKTFEQEGGEDKVLFSLEIIEDFRQLLDGFPVAYLIGHTSFLGCEIDLSLKPLIPRPETEYWLEKCLRSRNWEEEGKGKRVLDLCSGSGCLSVGTLKNFPLVELLAVDLDPQAVEQTQVNIQLLSDREGKSYQSEVRASDLFSDVDGRFDLVLCNPPYIDPSGTFSPELRFEPQQALFAQNNGFALINKIILNIKNFLKTEHSELWLEFQYDQAERVRALCAEENLVCQTHQDQFDRDRFAVISTKSASHHQS